MAFAIKRDGLKPKILRFCTYSVPYEIKKGSQSLETLVFASSGNWTRTSDLRVMSPTSYLLLYPAIYVVR